MEESRLQELNTICILYDPQFCTKGVLVPLSKVTSSSYGTKKVDALTELLRSRAPTGLNSIRGEIVAPIDHQHQLRLMKEQKKYDHPLGGGVPQQNNQRTSTSTDPERPALHKHKMGTIQTLGVATTFQQYVSDQTRSSSSKNQQQQPPMGSSSSRFGNKPPGIVAGMDPREALFRYQDKTLLLRRAMVLVRNHHPRHHNVREKELPRWAPSPVRHPSSRPRLWHNQ
jgi:hypothetical protein